MRSFPSYLTAETLLYWKENISILLAGRKESGGKETGRGV